MKAVIIDDELVAVGQFTKAQISKIEKWWDNARDLDVYDHDSMIEIYSTIPFKAVFVPSSHGCPSQIVKI